MTPKEKNKDYKRKWFLANKEKIKEKNLLNAEELENKRKSYYLKNSEKIKEKRKEYYLKNKEKSLIVTKEYQLKHRNDILVKKKKYRNENKIEIQKKKKEWNKNNRDKINKYISQRNKTNPIFKVSNSCRSLIIKSIKRNGFTKKSKTLEILGCSFEEFKLRLESKFEPWMNWDNYGLYNGELNYGWDIDHIIPISTAKTEEDVIKLNHHTNLQPLCSYTNRIIKKDNYNNL